MALDLHSKVTVKSIERAEMSSGVVCIRVIYRVKRGRKDYKLWALPRDLRETGIFPLRYSRMPKYGDVFGANGWLVFTGKHSDCRKFVQIANEDYEKGV